MTDDAAREAAPSTSPEKTETTETEIDAAPRVRTGLARLQDIGGSGRRQAAAREAKAETETETEDNGWRAKRRRTDGGVFAPVDPEKLTLTPKQDRFASLVAAGVPATVAAKTAGYAVAKVEASRLARLPHVRRKIHELRELKIDRLATPVLSRIADVALGRIVDAKLETQLKAMFWLAEAAGYGPKAKKDKEKDSDNNDMREWSIEALESFLTERDRSKRKAIATDAAVIAPDGTMEDTQHVEKTQETHPAQDRAGPSEEDGAAAGPAEPG